MDDDRSDDDDDDGDGDGDGGDKLVMTDRSLMHRVRNHMLQLDLPYLSSQVQPVSLVFMDLNGDPPQLLRFAKHRLVVIVSVARVSPACHSVVLFAVRI